MAQKQHLLQQLRDVGSRLEKPPPSKDGLIKLLKQVANYLSELEQSPSSSTSDAIKPSLDALAKAQLLKHQDKDVKVLVATCICEITRITAPEPPYSDEILRDIFRLFVWTFGGLSDINNPLFRRRVVILENLARYRSCVIMLDLDCADLIREMFSTFLSVVSDRHPQNVLMSMWKIMTLILDESEDIDESLLFLILSTLGRKKRDSSPAARNLAKKVIEHCMNKLEIPIKQFLLSSVSGDQSPSSNLLDYHEVIYDIYQCDPQILFGIIPYITGELLTDKLDVRLKAVNLLGDLFTLPGIPMLEPFRLMFSEFLKRLTDRVAEVRLSLVQHSRNCLISNVLEGEAPNIISALRDRLLDYDENVRKKVVAAIYDVACHKLDSFPSETTKIAAERLRDKSVSVKQYTLERLAQLYRLYCQDTSGRLSSDDFEWIPGKILRCLYDRDFRSDTVEDILCNFLFPSDFSVKDKVKHWLIFFSTFDKVDVKALEQMLMQKQRLQHELQKYLSLRQTCQDGDGAEHQKKVLGSFRAMARFFGDSTKADENFQFLNQLKDAKIWKNLSHLLDPSTSFCQSWAYRDELLCILGEKHPLYEFASALSMKSSFLFVNKEIVKEILDVVVAPISDGNRQLKACMNLLAVFASCFPLLFSGFEEVLVSLLKENNEVVKEGIAHVLAKGGGILREKLGTVSSSIDLLLEGLCLEGSRKQAKYAVQALAAITKDDGLKSLSVLYKRLVDMLEGKTHLPSILQSLGAIAQYAMPIFETREDEIIDFITKKILQCSKVGDNSQQQSEWSYQSELCKLKVFGLKALVKSFMPVKDSHLRTGIERLVENLKNILLFGDISKGIVSSAVDKAHMKLAAAKAVMRLYKQWEHKIPIDIIYMTFNVSQDSLPEARRIFKSKVHQYIKERTLDAKYACTFLYNIVESQPPDIVEDKRHLIEIIQMHHQLKARQLSMQCDLNPLVAYPEYILPWFIHALAHHPSLPNVEKSEDIQAFGPVYWRMHAFLSALMHGDENPQSDINSNRIRERFSAVEHIFQSIKLSEDAIYEAKTKNSQALCDLGLSIVKHLVQEKEDPVKLKTAVPLPVEIYKQRGMDNEEPSSVNIEKSWLGGDTALKYFESLESQGKENRELIENALAEIDIDANDLPLGAIMKKLKLRAAKKKKMLKKQACNSEIRKTENEIDVLGVVREINLGTKEDKNVRDLKLDKENSPSKTEPESLPNNKKDDLSKAKADKDTYLPSSVAKRKRSNYGTSPKTAKYRKKNGQSLKPSGSKDSAMEESPGDSEILVSCTSVAKSIVSGRKRVGPQQNTNGKTCDAEDERNIKGTRLPKETKIKATTSSGGQSRKRKRKSIARLEKCSQVMDDANKMVGQRIEVWWPLDKTYYEGKVQSYDEIKKKHEILYDDGDVEVLLLNKERWRLIGSNDKPKKKLKAQDSRTEEDLLLGENGETSKSRSLKKSRKNTSRRGAAKGKRANKKMKGKDDKGFHDNPPTNKEDGDSLHSQEHPSDSQEESARFPEDVIDNTDMVSKSSEAETGGSSSSSGDPSPNSDDEPLNAWRQRVGK